MKISKIDRQFLIRWASIGFVVGIGLTLETRLSVPDYLFGLISLLLGLALTYLLLVNYFDNTKLFVLLGILWVVLGFIVDPFVDSIATQYSREVQLGFPTFAYIAYFVISSLLVYIGQSLILRQEFEKAYLWVVGNVVALGTSTSVSLGIITVMARSQISAYLPVELLRLIDPISLVSNVVSLVIAYLITGSALSIILNSPKDTLETL